MNLNCEFFKAYVQCALWSSTDNADESGGEPLDKNYNINHIGGKTLGQMSFDCEEFRLANAADLEFVQSFNMCDMAKAGHNFWLNRNRHGSGFWDEYFGTDEALRAAFTRLSNASKAFGCFNLYVGDNGMIYGD